MTVKYHTERVGDYAVLRLSGDMLGSVSNSACINRGVSELLVKGERNIVFDVSCLATPSSDLVSIVTSTYKRVKRDGGSVGVIYDSSCSTDVFELCGVYKFVRHYLSLDVFKKEVKGR